jgi:hypothetical protein
MKGKVNIKIVATLSFQLIIIMVLAWFSTTYIEKLSVSSSNIIKDNLRSVEYCDSMQRALYRLHINPNDLASRIAFENKLQAEQDNITETGEKEAADVIKNNYFQWLKTPADDIFYTLMGNINSVNELNTDAIKKKNAAAQEVADSANKGILTVSLLGAVVALLFTFVFIGQLIQPKEDS